jgi:hypothetical protein
MFEEKTIVQHRLCGERLSRVFYSNYGQSYRLE